MFAQNTLAISIEGSSIRLLRCRGRTVLSWDEVPLDSRLLRSGFLTDARGFAKALESSTKLARTTGGNVVAALPGFQSFSRVLQAPKPVGRHIGTWIAGEARRSYPDVERSMFLRWQLFGPKTDSRQSIFVLAVPRQPLITYIQALSAANLRPKAVDLHPLALARGVNARDAIIGNAESMSLDVVVVRDDIPVLMRSMHLGEDYAPVEYVNARLVEEIARTIVHFNNISQDGQLAADTPVFLTGRGAAEPSLAAMVQEATPYPVAPLKLPFDYPDDFPVSDFMVHLGLVLK